MLICRNRYCDNPWLTNSNYLRQTRRRPRPTEKSSVISRQTPGLATVQLKRQINILGLLTIGNSQCKSLERQLIDRRCPNINRSNPYSTANRCRHLRRQDPRATNRRHRFTDHQGPWLVRQRIKPHHGDRRRRRHPPRQTPGHSRTIPKRPFRQTPPIRLRRNRIRSSIPISACQHRWPTSS